MAKYLFLLSHLIFSHNLFSQPTIQWQRTLGGTTYDEPRSIVQTTDGGYFITGLTDSNDGAISDNHGITDFWAVKMDSLGVVQWKKAYGGAGEDWGFDGKQTLDGGFIMAGHTRSNDGNVSGNHGDKDAWIIKLASDGSIEWQKCFGGTKREEAWEIQQTLDGGYIFAGQSSSTDGDLTENNGSSDYWIVKLNSTGEIQWQKSLGGSSLDLCYTICVNSDGGYIVTGEAFSTDGDVSTNNSGVAIWVVKLNFEGKILWEKSLGGSGLERGNKIIEARDGGYALISITRSNDGDVTGHHGGYDLWVVKLNATGDILWQKALGGSSEDYGQGIYQTNDGGFVVTGHVNSTDGDVTDNHGYTDTWVVKLSETGDLLWQKALGGTSADYGFSVQQTTDHGYIIAGSTWSNNGDVTTPSQGKTDFWIIKLNPETSPTTQPTTQPLNLYPNPAQNTLKIQIPTPANRANISIQDPLGRVLLRQNLSLDSFGAAQIELTQVPPGFYFVQATTPDGQVFSGKIQKLE